MQILVRDQYVIDYCEEGYVQMECTVVCPSKNKTFENCIIVTVNDIPSDIDKVIYRYVNGEFINVKRQDDSHIIVRFDIVSNTASHTIEEIVKALDSSIDVLGYLDNRYYNITSRTIDGEDIILRFECIVYPIIFSITYNNSGIVSTYNELPPEYSYGTEDLVAGESPLESGKLYFVYK